MNNNQPVSSADELFFAGEEATITFADEETLALSQLESDQGSWEVLIIDDEKQIHQVTKWY